VETGAHRDELESRATFLGVVEAAKPPADFAPVASNWTWGCTAAPAARAGASACCAVTAAASRWRAAAILGDYWKRERKYHNE
jgi:hypothetical protein